MAEVARFIYGVITRGNGRTATPKALTQTILSHASLWKLVSKSRNMSDTPYTDRRTYKFTDGDGIHCEAIHADFARKLELERDQWKDIAERSIGYVYDNDWDPEARDIIKNYEKLAGGPHPIHSR